MKGAHTFFEIVPEYFQSVIYDLVIDLAAILILALLMVQFFRRKHRNFELILFFQMCLCNMLMVIFAMAFDIAPAFWTINEDNLAFYGIIGFTVPFVLNQIFACMLLAQWLIYVEYTLHQSRDLIRRRYAVAMVPFIAAVIMMILSVPIAFWKNAPFNHEHVYTMLTIISHTILVLYIAAAYFILYLEKKRNRIPAYIRLTPTSVCMFAGYAAGMFTPLGAYPVLPFSFALGLLFADYYMYRRLRHIDPKTGFYNRKYLPVLIKFSKKNRLTGATVIRFRERDKNGALAAILKSWEPDLSKTIIMGDGVYLMVSEAVNNSVSDRFIDLVAQQAESRGIAVEADYETDREGLMGELLEKYV